MAEIKFTKTQLRIEQQRLSQLEKYLPTLKLKKILLQKEVNDARVEAEMYEEQLNEAESHVASYRPLFQELRGFDLKAALKIERIEKHYENIAGIEIPIFEKLVFADYPYSLTVTPAWVDQVLVDLFHLETLRAHIDVIKEKQKALEEELREVSIRVNLFEKILIPRAERNIRRIKVFLGDQELAAVGRAKVAKGKIEARRQEPSKGERVCG